MKELCAALILTTSSAHALCSDLTDLLDGATQMSLPQPFDTAVECTMSLALSRETSTHCAWPFAYRAPQASAAFTALVNAVSDCFASIPETRDQDVNHPDFYDLRIFNAPQGEIGISLKDKGGLQQTYVFLRVTPAK